MDFRGVSGTTREEKRAAKRRVFVQSAVASRRQAPSQCAVKMPGWERVDRGWRASVVAVSTPRLPGRGKEADSDGSSKAQLGSAERKCALYVLTAASRSSWSRLRSRSLVTGSEVLLSPRRKVDVERPSSPGERCVWRGDGRPTEKREPYTYTRERERTSLSLCHSEHIPSFQCVSVALFLSRSPSLEAIVSLRSLCLCPSVYLLLAVSAPVFAHTHTHT